MTKETAEARYRAAQTTYVLNPNASTQRLLDDALAQWREAAEQEAVFRCIEDALEQARRLR